LDKNTILLDLVRTNIFVDILHSIWLINWELNMN